MDRRVGCSADFVGIGISGLDLEGTLLDYDHSEVRASQVILGNDRQVFLATDHAKCARPSMVRRGGFWDAGALFADAAPPRPIYQLLEAGGLVLPGIPRSQNFQVANFICSDVEIPQETENGGCHISADKHAGCQQWHQWYRYRPRRRLPWFIGRAGRAE